ncbi:hypothetical protein HK098_006363, partial [Nowakowskiella sp. JEL0407]
MPEKKKFSTKLYPLMAFTAFKTTGFFISIHGLESVVKLKEDYNITEKFTIYFESKKGLELRLTKISDEEGFKFWLLTVKEKRLEHELVIKLDTTAVTASTLAPVTVTSPISIGVPVVSTTVSADDTVDISTSFDVMLSYNWGDQANVLTVKKGLKDRGLSVWMDLDEMHKNIYEEMARA